MATNKTVNRVTLVGRLGRDAETKFTPGGAAVTRLSVATERSWKDKHTEEWKSETEWHNVTMWRQEKLASYLTKGSNVYVEGRLQTRSYDKDGEKRWSTEVIVERIILHGSASGNGGAQSGTDTESYDGGTAGDDDVPF